ncbi:MAG: class I SAM-dependent methyltransferase [Caldilineaceae bacterium]|nr:class I SAM-dependent methyltransferase [Caldilineaceae bacterium]
MDATPLGNEWTTVEHALAYLTRADQVPHRGEAEAILLEVIPKDVDRILDLGTGDGRLLGLLRIDRGDAAGVAIDFSPTMLAKARERFHGDTKVQVLEHDLEKPLPDMGRFDAIVSSFAIHHCTDQRKQSLYSEIYATLTPGGVFCNLEHVAPTSNELHGQFLEAFGITEADEDPSNKLVGLETQLHWLREIGFDDVSCHWQWLELALFSGIRKGLTKQS